MKLPGALRALAVLVLIFGVAEGIMALMAMQLLGTSVAGMVDSLQKALNALPNAPRTGVNPGVGVIMAHIVAAGLVMWGYVMLWWGVSAGVVAAALLWAAAYALDLLQSTHAAVTRMARTSVPPRG